MFHLQNGSNWFSDSKHRWRYIVINCKRFCLIIMTFMYFLYLSINTVLVKIKALCAAESALFFISVWKLCLLNQVYGSSNIQELSEGFIVQQCRAEPFFLGHRCVCTDRGWINRYGCKVNAVRASRKTYEYLYKRGKRAVFYISNTQLSQLKPVNHKLWVSSIVLPCMRF